jgi:hypothetical protein
MIDVRVRERDGVDARRRNGERRAVAQAQLLVALEKAAVDEQPRIVRIEHEARAGHGAGSAMEAELDHSVLVMPGAWRVS